MLFDTCYLRYARWLIVGLLWKGTLADSLFEELKRRKVIRVATAYVVGAWLLVQISDVVGEPLGIPLWVQTGLIIALAVLFPVVLIVTWIYELTSKGLVRDPADVRVDVTAEALALKSDDYARVAVLPFVELAAGETPEDQYFGDGVAEEVINRIARHKDIRVIARTSSFQFRGAEVDLQAIRDELNVSHLVTGSVRRSEGYHRVSMQLVDAIDNSQLWADSVQRRVDKPFDTQSEVAQVVDNALVEIFKIDSLDATRGWTLAPEAQEEYLIAREAFWQADFPAVLEHAGRSSEIDPNNPLLLTMVAQVYLVWPRYGFSVGKDELRLASRNVSSALKVDQDYPGARAARGMLSLFLERDFQTAFETVSKAALAHPSVAEWMPQLLVYAGRYKEAVELHRRIAQRDPLNPSNLLIWANRLNWLGKRDVAQSICERAEDIAPDHLILKNNKFRWAVRDGDFDRARAQMAEWGMDPDKPEAEPNVPWIPRSISLWLGSRLFGASGDTERAYAQAQEIEKEPGFTPTTVAEAYINAGAIDDAYRIWDMGISQYDLGVYDLAQPPDMRDPDDPMWLAFREDARYEECLERLGLDEESLRDVDWSSALKVLL